MQLRITDHAKQSSPFIHFSNGFADMINAFLLMAGDQHTESFCAEPSAIDLHRLCCLVGLQFSQYTALPQITSLDGHGASVCFQEVVRAFDAPVRMRDFEREDFVGHDTDTTFTWEIDCPAEGFTAVLSAAGLGEFVRVEKPNVGSLAAVEFEPCHEVTHHQGVFDEQSAYPLGASRPFHAFKWHI